MTPTTNDAEALALSAMAATLSDERRAVRFLELTLRLLRSGGVLLSDNVLCDGQVTRERPSGAAVGIGEYNGRLMTHPELETSIVPIRDGVAISLKR